MYSKIIFILIICAVPGYSLKDGDLYRFTSATDNHAITVTRSDSTNGINVTIEPSQDGSDQQFLAVQAVQASDSYLLLPKRQVWDWNQFVKNTTKDRLDFLPDNTVVLAQDPITGSVVQLRFNGKKPQQWKSVDVSQGKSIIKNLNGDKCLTNPGLPQEPTRSTFSKIKSSVKGLVGKKKEKMRPKIFATLNDCNGSDQKQMWLITTIV